MEVVDGELWGVMAAGLKVSGRVRCQPSRVVRLDLKTQKDLLNILVPHGANRILSKEKNRWISRNISNIIVQQFQLKRSWN